MNVARKIRRGVWTACVAAALAVTARGGGVVTREGKAIDGAVAPAGADELTVTPAGGAAAATTVKLTDVRSATFGAPTTAPTTAPSLAKWAHADVGTVHNAGTASESDGVFTIAGSGWGLWGPRDSGHAVYWPFDGDGQVIAHVVAGDEEQGGARAGVMFRSTMDADSAFAAAVLYPNGEVRLNRRPLEGWAGGPDGNKQGPAQAWVRVTRAGERVTAYRSKDGRYWQPVATQAVALADKGVAGLFASSGTNSRLATARFDHVRLIAGTPAATYFDGATGPASGVVMVDGTMLAGWVDSVADGQVRIWPHYGADGRELAKPKTDAERKALQGRQLSFPIEQVARVRLAPEPPDLEKVTPAGGAPGVLLLTGDFVEGEVDRFSYGTYLDLKSVLFGTKRMEAGKDAISLVLRGETPVRGAYEVRTRDGSVVQADAVTFDGGRVNVRGATVGAVTWPVSELVSVEGK